MGSHSLEEMRVRVRVRVRVMVRVRVRVRVRNERYFNLRKMPKTCAGNP